MTHRTKNILYSAILFLSLFAVFMYRRASGPTPLMLSGSTMGTTYHITYFDEQQRDFKQSIDSLLQVFNQSLNTYLPDSEITRFNKGDSSFKFELPYFFPVLERSQQITAASQGAFDPTVMPLVNAWGFGPEKQTEPNSHQIDSILKFTGFEKIGFNKDSVWKFDPRVQLDFSAIAKGYGVDAVANLLASLGITDMFVEIGGEVVARGKNIRKEKSWEVGILDPNSTPAQQSFKAFVLLEDRALATSGNYFNYKEKDGKKYSHTIDPITGYPVQRSILSASVFASDCMTADAWATACMVMGHEQAIPLLEAQKEISAILFFTAPDGALKIYSSPALQKQITFAD